MARPGAHSKQPAMKRYKDKNSRYSNKVRKATKRYGKCKPEILKKVIEKIVKYRKNYTKQERV